jgi:thioredoxin 1
MVLSLESDAEFDRCVTQSQGYVLVDYHAEWCGPCKRIAPTIERLSTEWVDVKFYKVDVDELRDTSDEQNVQSMPTFILYKDGQEVSRVSGANELHIVKLLGKTTSL